MKYFLGLLALSLLVAYTPASAQSKWGLAIYHNTDIFQVNEWRSYPHFEYSEWRKQADRFSIAVTFSRRKNWVNELEILVPEFNRSVDKIQSPYPHTIYRDPGTRVKVQAFAFRYGLSKSFVLKSGKLRGNAGVAVNPYYTRTDAIGRVGHVPLDFTTFGMSLNLLPALQYTLSDRIGISLSIPVKVYDVTLVKDYGDNPIIPIGLQEEHKVNHTFFSQAYTIRLGLHIDLSKTQNPARRAPKAKLRGKRTWRKY